jgi:hypothetical protein
MWELAQINVADAVDRLDSPALAGFVELLEPLDRLARESPGFVWRPRAEELDPAELALFGDLHRQVVNLSVWESPEALRGFLFGPGHGPAVRRRADWFHRPRQPSTALWWVRGGRRPTFPEAYGRLARLRGLGPTAEAFTLARTFPPPASP